MNQHTKYLAKILSFCLKVTVCRISSNFVSDTALFVLKRDVKLQLTN